MWLVTEGIRTHGGVRAVYERRCCEPRTACSTARPHLSAFGAIELGSPNLATPMSNTTILNCQFRNAAAIGGAIARIAQAHGFHASRRSSSMQLVHSWQRIGAATRLRGAACRTARDLFLCATRARSLPLVHRFHHEVLHAGRHVVGPEAMRLTILRVAREGLPHGHARLSRRAEVSADEFD